MKKLLIVLLSAFGFLFAWDEAPFFLLDIRSYSVIFNSSFSSHDFNPEGGIERIPAGGFFFEPRLFGSAKLKYRPVSLSATGDIGARLFYNRAAGDIAGGIGDVRLFAFHVFGGRATAAASAVIPTGPYVNGIGEGAYKLGLTAVYRFSSEIEAYMFGRHCFAGPDGIRRGAEAGACAEWERFLNLGLSFIYRWPDEDPWASVKDSPTYVMSAKAGIAADIFRQVKGFLYLHSDVLGGDAPFHMGITVGAFF
jgi:hypothetical protein